MFLHLRLIPIISCWPVFPFLIALSIEDALYAMAPFDDAFIDDLLARSTARGKYVVPGFDQCVGELACVNTWPFAQYHPYPGLPRLYRGTARGGSPQIPVWFF